MDPNSLARLRCSLIPSIRSLLRQELKARFARIDIVGTIAQVRLELDENQSAPSGS